MTMEADLIWFGRRPHSSPKRRIETDVMKMCVCPPEPPRATAGLGLVLRTARRRLMSDIEVTLVNDNMQEFYVRFFGPAESQL